MKEFIAAPWFILQDPKSPGEHLTAQVLGGKYALVWQSQASALEFARLSPSGAGMEASELKSWTLKETFLRVAQALGANGILIGYQPGLPQAATLDLAEALRALQELH